ncbi:Protein FAM189A1 [Liparis tanakae]|uniref:Protein FAM189A1 n=1 Tax=Liparis tanakae TaxID=230148 RepID=A0A4Z2HRK3_9TELE|nr:Protein FAM189A1 [Liparis tanakae]
MSLPVVLPGSCCPVVGAPPLGESPYRNRPRGLSASSPLTGGDSQILLPGRPLLSLGLLQLLLGGSMVVLCFGALSLSNSPPIRNSCPFWAGSSVTRQWAGMLTSSPARKLVDSVVAEGGASFAFVTGKGMVILSGIVGLTTWRRPMLLLVSVGLGFLL